jgi:hypothetical protein
MRGLATPDDLSPRVRSATPSAMPSRVSSPLTSFSGTCEVTRDVPQRLEHVELDRRTGEVELLAKKMELVGVRMPPARSAALLSGAKHIASATPCSQSEDPSARPASMYSPFFADTSPRGKPRRIRIRPVDEHG